ARTRQQGRRRARAALAKLAGLAPPRGEELAHLGLVVGVVLDPVEALAERFEQVEGFGPVRDDIGDGLFRFARDRVVVVHASPPRAPRRTLWRAQAPRFGVRALRFRP